MCAQEDGLLLAAKNQFAYCLGNPVLIIRGGNVFGNRFQRVYRIGHCNWHTSNFKHTDIVKIVAEYGGFLKIDTKLLGEEY